MSDKFVSVTYGAGGTTQDRTFDAVKAISGAGLKTAAHLTCVDASREQIDAIVDEYYDAGIRRIVALRGDSPNGIDKAYTPTPGGYAYGSDLVAGIKSRHADMDISISAYPELHPESGKTEYAPQVLSCRLCRELCCNPTSKVFAI